jgi:hypothetical protein
MPESPNFICFLGTFSARRLMDGATGGVFVAKPFDMMELGEMRQSPSVAWVCPVAARDEADAEAQALKAWRAGLGEITFGGKAKGITQPQQGIPQTSASRGTASSGNAKVKCAAPVPAGHGFMTTTNLKHLPTTELTLHAAASRLPRMADDAPEFAALLIHIAEHGITEPIKVNQFRVVVGVDTWEAAKQLGIKSVPCVEIGPDEIFGHLSAALLARQHYTKGQIAYLATPLLEPLLDASRKRRAANVATRMSKSGKGQNPDSALSALSSPSLSKFALAKTAEQLAEALGISRRLFFFAAAIHRDFAADPGLRARFEPAILEQGEDGAAMGLGAVVAGIAGHKATKGITPHQQPELQLWGDKVSKWFDPRKWAGWDKITPETQQAVAEKFASELLAATPPEVIERIELAVAQRLGVRKPTNLKVA